MKMSEKRMETGTSSAIYGLGFIGSYLLHYDSCHFLGWCFGCIKGRSLAGVFSV